MQASVFEAVQINKRVYDEIYLELPHSTLTEDVALGHYLVRKENSRLYIFVEDVKFKDLYRWTESQSKNTWAPVHRTPQKKKSKAVAK